MSRAALRIDARIGQALAQVALLPAAVQAAFRERLYDLLSHHRLHVLKHHRLPSGRAAQRMLATRLWRYTRASARDAGVAGEAFVAAASGDTYGADAFRRLEFGGDVAAGAPMAVPIGAGRVLARRDRAAWRRLLGSGVLEAIRTRAGRTLLIRETAGRARDAGGAKSLLYAVLTRRRRQPAQLGYFAGFEAVQARHVAKMEQDLERAASAAGQAALVEASRERAALDAAYLQGLRRYLAAHPNRLREARAAGLAARRAARAANTVRGGRA